MTTTVSQHPSCILDDLLYLGTKEHAEDADALTACGITHIVNATDNLSNLFSEERCLASDTPRQYHRVPVRDVRAEAIDMFFDGACSFIQDALASNNGRVLVHCMAGRSRSATIVIAFLLKCRGLDLSGAFELVRARRPCSLPNLGFWQQLEAYEERVCGGCSATPDVFVKAKAMDAKLRGTADGALAHHATPGTTSAADVCSRFLHAASAQLGADVEASVLSRWPAELSGDAAVAALGGALLASLDGPAERIRFVPRLLWLLVHQHGVVNLPQAQKALAEGVLAQDLDDLQIDIPHVWRHVANVSDGCRACGLLTAEVAVAHGGVLEKAAAVMREARDLEGGSEDATLLYII
eukprot:CAMPEP_0115853294 /NCGR_PEP_ID=MMETSP0287-20121206/13430_1 /TAXON_ID=412157 /ORGANISM="Chrysochromulina rotalis, Strain UIO044" /LENGTH=352 /DNA_ID=CAMNT_0003307367 /DNA_START=28 /DNA_END=1086 /DNA_ORIENTATION=-